MEKIMCPRGGSRVLDKSHLCPRGAGPKCIMCLGESRKKQIMCATGPGMERTMCPREFQTNQPHNVSWASKTSLQLCKGVYHSANIAVFQALFSFSFMHGETWEQD